MLKGMISGEDILVKKNKTQESSSHTIYTVYVRKEKERKLEIN